MHQISLPPLLVVVVPIDSSWNNVMGHVQWSVWVECFPNYRPTFVPSKLFCHLLILIVFGINLTNVFFLLLLVLEYFVLGRLVLLLVLFCFFGVLVAFSVHTILIIIVKITIILIISTIIATTIITTSINIVIIINVTI